LVHIKYYLENCPNYCDTGFGLNVVSGAYIQTRVSIGAPVTIYGIVDKLSMGSDSGTIFAGHVATDWFNINLKSKKILTNKDVFLGKTAQLEVAGSMIVSGKTDVKLTVYDKIGSGTTVFDIIDIASSGGQISSTKVRGILKVLVNKKQVPAIP